MNDISYKVSNNGGSIIVVVAAVLTGVVVS